MLTKNQRLTRDEFSTVFEHGKRINSDAFTLIYAPSKETPKASAVVSKKIAGGVITRNLLKRRLYNVIKSELNQDTILLAKKGMKGKSFAELVEEYKGLVVNTK